MARRRMTGLATRSGTSNRVFYRRIPADLVKRLYGNTVLFTFPDSPSHNASRRTICVTVTNRVRVSLGTADESLAIQRNALLTAHLETVYSQARNGPRTLSHKEIIALSGEVYRLFIDKFQENPGDASLWAAVKGFNRATKEGRLLTASPLTPDNIDLNKEAHSIFGTDLTAGINALPSTAQPDVSALETRFGWLADWVLAKHGFLVDVESRSKLLLEAERASTEAAWQLKRNAGGDYSPDPTASRYPPVAPVATKPETTPSSGFTFESLFADYKRTSGKRGSRTPATIAEYHRTFVTELPAFLLETFKHRDPATITLQHMVAWRDSLLKRGLSPKTVKDKKIAAVKAIFERAARDGKLPHNPASKVDIAVPRRVVTRPKGFTDIEAETILKAALNFKGGRHGAKTIAAIRWTPWLGAYSGARIVELTQLRGKDVLQTNEGWIMRLTPEAGSIKTGQYRDIPIHPHLIELGFLTFVKQSGQGPLFYQTASPNEVNVNKAQVVSQRVSDWVRKDVGITDKKVQPTHGWRHRFETVARMVGMDAEARAYIPGHTIPGMGAIYGDMAGLHREIAKLPRLSGEA